MGQTCMSSEGDRADIAAAFREVRAVSGDILLFHSSLKCIGRVRGRASTVSYGTPPGGTVALPTLWYNGKLKNKRRAEK